MLAICSVLSVPEVLGCREEENAWVANPESRIFMIRRCLGVKPETIYSMQLRLESAGPYSYWQFTLYCVLHHGYIIWEVTTDNSRIFALLRICSLLQRSTNAECHQDSNHHHPFRICSRMSWQAMAHQVHVKSLSERLDRQWPTKLMSKACLSSQARCET